MDELKKSSPHFPVLGQSINIHVYSCMFVWVWWDFILVVFADCAFDRSFSYLALIEYTQKREAEKSPNNNFFEVYCCFVIFDWAINCTFIFFPLVFSFFPVCAILSYLVFDICWLSYSLNPIWFILTIVGHTAAVVTLSMCVCVCARARICTQLFDLITFSYSVLSSNRHNNDNYIVVCFSPLFLYFCFDFCCCFCLLVLFQCKNVALHLYDLYMSSCMNC